MLITLLIVLGCVVGALLLAVLALRLITMTSFGQTTVMPWIARRRWVQRLVMRQMRSQAERQGRAVDTQGVRVSDMELMLDAAAESSEEARQAKEMLAAMTPQQRRQAARLMQRMNESGMTELPEIQLGRDARRAAARAQRKKGMR